MFNLRFVRYGKQADGKATSRYRFLLQSGFIGYHNLTNCICLRIGLVIGIFRIGINRGNILLAGIQEIE
ncbi:hypothetical protein SDC9_143047 [bioreactor metagenome]|uniref:Uncharacterized protein n=1 Tax=bioreactor metagenome TaxID=1076179 RepID=A0A645E2W2_9ZZZZ